MEMEAIKSTTKAMKESMIQKYLDSQFIKAENEQETNFINESVKETKPLLTSNKMVIAGTLVVLDPSVRKDALVDQVNEIISRHWTLFKNKNKPEKAVTVIRAIILQALSEIATENIQVTATIWLTAKNMLPHAVLDREQRMIQPWLNDVNVSYQTEAYNQWGIPNLQRGAMRVDKITKQIEKLIADQFVPLDKVTVSANYPEWKNELVAAVTNSFSNVLVKQFGVKELSDTQNTLNQRNQLLWIKESEYSFSVDKPYKKISPKLLPLVIASDVSKLTGRFFPSSVPFFVETLLAKVTGGEDKKISLKELCEEAGKDEQAKALIVSDADVGLKCNVLQFISMLSSGKCQIKSCEEMTGLKSSVQLTYAQWANWLINDFSAANPYE